MSDRLRVAAIITIYHPKSHADVIVTKFLKGMSTDEGFLSPEIDIVSIYLDHALENDIGLGLAEKYDVPVYPSIRRALHAGASELNVDAVLLVGEHGDYPWNERGRHMYPRRYFFEQIAGVFGESGRSVPVFNDKHLAYSFADAQWMWDRAQELEIPLMAGSSLPLCWRNPYVEYDKETKVEEALSVGYGGIEAYGYHALETLQCMVERRQGGETGVVSVQCLEDDAVWQARDEGLWSAELATAACDAIQHKPEGPMEDHVKDPAVFLVEYADGLKTATLMLSGYVSDFSYAARVDGQVQGVEFYLQNEGPFAHFGYLCRNVQDFFRTKKAPYPPERTLLTTGIIDAAMNSRHEDHRKIETPYLNIAYSSYDQLPHRPSSTRPAGASIDPQALDII
ncbi:MAG TPA: hypothetical protein EYG11_11665 [Candidatus Latescibacteria bacterium]|nr:hypothetical protein [Candidatus Handelsmanbacteria bacterium]HIL09353.1 hypothetical protein [Candidatus Latescibacterota bacterium]